MTAATPGEAGHICPGCRASEARCITAIRGGAVKCCPDCDHHANCRAALANRGAALDQARRDGAAEALRTAADDLEAEDLMAAYGISPCAGGGNFIAGARRYLRARAAALAEQGDGG